MEESGEPIMKKPVQRAGMAGPCFEGKLTHKALLGLPEGALLASESCADGPYEASIMEVLGPLESRADLWHRLCLLGLAGSHFCAFCDSASFKARLGERVSALLERARRAG